MNSKRTRTLSFALILCVVPFGCASDEALSLDGPLADVAPEFDDIRRRLPLTIRPGTNGFAGITTPSNVRCTAEDCLPEAFAGGVYRACVPKTGDEVGNVRSQLCGLRNIEDYVCTATTLLTTIEHPAPRMVRISPTTDLNAGGMVLVPPQDAETNAELARLAFMWANIALQVSSERLSDDPDYGCPTLELPANAGTGAYEELSNAEELAYFYRESLELVRRAAEHALRAGATVTDAARSRRSDRALASTATLAPFASRTAAAHMLIGGATADGIDTDPVAMGIQGTATGLPAIAGVDRQGFFTRPPLSAEGQRALELIRAAAPDPTLIAAISGPDQVEIDDLVAGSGAVAVADSLQFRLGHMQDRQALLDAAGATVVYELLGVSRAGFTEAREYMREELRAFDRSRNATLPAEPLAERPNTTDDEEIVLYAATRVPPRQLLASYWSAVVRYDPTPLMLSGYPDVDVPPDWDWQPTHEGLLPSGYTWGQETDAGIDTLVVGQRTLASILDEVAHRSPEIIGYLCPGGSCPDERLERARDAIAGALSDFNSSPSINADPALGQIDRYDGAYYIGHARVCWYQGISDSLRIELPATLDTDELLVVNGRDSLNCAVDGVLEGTPCSTSFLNSGSNVPDISGWSSSGDVSHTMVKDVAVSTEDRPAPDTVSVFVVRRRPGYAGTPRPGQYEQLTGWVLPKPPGTATGYRYCQSTVIAPGVDKEIVDAVAPSPEVPSESSISCTGLPADFHIPLENELTDDGNGVESSWRYYLDLARRAAADADELGENLIRTGLTMDERSETAANELTRICGVHVNVSSIARALEEDAPPPVSAAGPPCMLPYLQHGTECVLDPVLYAAERAGVSDDLAGLASCIGADVLPWATLGDRPLCLWDASPGTVGGICEGGPVGRTCPEILAVGATASACTAPAGTEAIFVPQSAAMGIFTPPEPGTGEPPTDPTRLACDALANLRSGDLSAVTPLVNSPLWSLDTLAVLAQQLRWEALPGDYSQVRFGGTVLFGTGHPSSPAATAASAWPMGDTLPAHAVCPPGWRIGPFPEGWEDGWTGPLFCLEDGWTNSTATSGDERRRRARFNDLLGRAVVALRTVTGVGMNGLIVAFSPATIALEFHENTSQFSYLPLSGSSPPVYCSNVGDFHFDWSDGTFGGDSPINIPLSELGSRACYIQGGPPSCPGGTYINSTAEWSRCSYDSDYCNVHDDAQDCDDSTATEFARYRSDRNLPLILTTLGGELDRPGTARPAAAAIWPRLKGQLLVAALGGDASLLRSPPRLGTLSDLTLYYGLAESGPARGTNINARLAPTTDSGQVPDGGAGPTTADILNGIELACVAARQDVPGSAASNCADPGVIGSLVDAGRFQEFLQCQANEMAGEGARTLLQDVPSRVVDTLRRNGAASYGDGAGEYDGQVSDIRAGFLALVGLRQAAAVETSALASELQALRSAVANAERGGEIEELMTLGRKFDRITQCVTAVVTVASSDTVGIPGKAVAAAATCVNSMAQVILDGQIATLREMMVDEEIIRMFASFNTSAVGFGGRMQGHILAAKESLERMDGAIARLHALQTQARRHLAQALMLEDDGLQMHFSTDTAYRTLYSVQLARYERAHERALRAAAIARVALEQRLGMPLSSIEEDLFSGDAPSAWVDTLCTLPSIDYDRLRGSTPGPTGERDADGEDFAGPDGFEGAWVGDYVTRLGDVFDSYSFVHPFREGTDTAVVSLRDDVFRTRAECPSATPNLLYNGGSLDAFANDSRPGWTVEHCDPSAVTIGDPDCLALERLPADAPTGDVRDSDIGRPQAYSVRFGASAAVSANTRLSQSVDVRRGRYRVSWYAALGETGMIVPGNSVSAAGDHATRIGFTFEQSVSGTTTWRRYWFFVDVAADSALTVLVHAPGHGPGTAVDVRAAGLMLEDVTEFVAGNVNGTRVVRLGDGSSESVVVGQHAVPAPFVDAGDTGLVLRGVCRDDEGRGFRRTAWRYGCTRVCADGYDSSCSPDEEESRCFWQTSFDVSANALGARLLAGDAGFAAGNHNYRIESVAVNLVGTGLRDCEESGTAGCYGSGNFSYSMQHLPPFNVLNARGQTYEAPLFAGRMEGARALAAERYLTNPISSADATLLGPPYTRAEFQGRPMGGTIELRIWDDPALRFDRLEDVQVILGYRYWQHQR